MQDKNSFEMLAKTLFGLEEILAGELKNIGAKDVVVRNRAVSFMGDKALMYKANLYLRTALKILVPIRKFKVRSEDDLYQLMGHIKWTKYMSVSDTLAVDGTVNSPYFTHSQYIALKTKDAIVDQFRKRFNERPSVDTEYPDLRINVHISNETCTVSLDSSGEPLNKRGYRIRRDIAPLNEVLAAGMIMLSGWEGKSNLIDPMCGSGTILIEAAMIALGIPACIMRKEFAFEFWKDFDSDLWNDILDEAEKHKNFFDHKIYGADMSTKAFLIAKENIKNAGLSRVIKLAIKDFEDFEPPEEPGVVITNPPYGERIQPEDINRLYAMMGERLKHNFSGYDAWFISSNKEALKHVGLRPSVKKTLYNGALECKFQKYELYRGSKKAKKQ